MKTTAENRIGGLLREFRRRVYETGLQLQCMEQGNEEQEMKVMQGLHGLTGFGLLTANEEKKTLFPSLVIAAPFMVPLLEQELEKVIALANKMNALADAFEDCFSVREKKDCFRQMQRNFQEWAAVVLQHLGRMDVMMEDVMEEMPGETIALSLVA